jgi:predicted kinase
MRHRRQRALVCPCIAAGRRFVVDNTNVLREERADIIRRAKGGHFKAIGYFFEPQIEESLARKAQRSGKARVPAKGVLGTLKRLERPSPDEGFDQLHTVA